MLTERSINIHIIQTLTLLSQVKDSYFRKGCFKTEVTLWLLQEANAALQTAANLHMPQTRKQQYHLFGDVFMSS